MKDTIKIGYNVKSKTAKDYRKVSTLMHGQPYFNPIFNHLFEAVRKTMKNRGIRYNLAGTECSEREQGDCVYTAIIFVFYHKGNFEKASVKKLVYEVCDGFFITHKQPEYSQD